MSNMKKRLLLTLAAVTMALTAAPAVAEERIIEFVFPPSYTTTTQYCYTEGGYWRWDGVQYVWVNSQTVCQYE